jgi:hypothetical protein
LIDKRYGHIDNHNEAASNGRFPVAKATFHVAPHKSGDLTMTTFLTYIDRTALTLINVLVIAGLPLAAVGFLTSTL